MKKLCELPGCGREGGAVRLRLNVGAGKGARDNIHYFCGREHAEGWKRLLRRVYHQGARHGKAQDATG